MNIIQLTVSTDGSGDGAATDPVQRDGYVLQWHADFAAGTAATADTTLSCVSSTGPDITIDSIANSATDAWRRPLAVANVPGGAAGTDAIMPIGFRGNLKVTVAQGGATVASAVVVTIYLAKVP